MPPITALLPVRAEDAPGDAFQRALRSIAEQSLPAEMIIVVMDHPSGASEGFVRDAATAIRSALTALDHSSVNSSLIVRNRTTLSESLNEGLSTCTTPFVARQDADDVSHPERFAMQAQHLERDPSLALVGTWARRVTPDGDVLEHITPPTDPGTLRWSVLVENPIVHGSVMMRRDAILDVGGYDPSLTCAQDHELWIRVAERAPIANLPEPLYDHTDHADHDGTRRSARQARVAAKAMLDSWRRLRSISDQQQDDALDAMTGALTGDAHSAHALMSTPPSREGLMAMLFTRTQTHHHPTNAVRTAQRALAREIVNKMAHDGADAFWIWGAGRHTRALMEDPHGYTLPVAGIVDDHAARCEPIAGHDIQTPDAIPAGAHALLSSDWHEASLWRASAGARERGVRVWSMYSTHSAPIGV
ncbi:MAG: hypothetical protein Tsb0013_22010 [Phycisphaerales bacterium]